MGASIFNVTAFFVVLREVLEACLIIGIILAYLSKTGADHLRRQVWVGTASAVALSLVLGVAFAAVYYSKGSQILSGKREKIFDGTIFVVAAALLTWMIFWMMAMGSTLQKKMERHVDRAIDDDDSPDSLSAARVEDDAIVGGRDGGRRKKDSRYALAIMVFVQVLREGIETMVFLFGASSASGGGKDAWRGIPIPGLLGLAVGLVSSYLVFKGLVSLDINTLLFYSTAILIAFAAGLVSHGMHEFQEAGWFGQYEAEGVPEKWWNAKLFDIGECCSDEDNQFFAMARALFGYQDDPSFVELVAYFGYWALIAIILVTANWTAVRAARNRAASLARTTSAIALISFFVGFIYAVSNVTWTGVLTTSLGLLISVAAVATSFDTLSAWSAPLKAVRKTLALATSVSAAVFSALVIALHFAQLSCIQKWCALPQFYYWGLIFNPEFNARADTTTSYASVGVLTFSLIFSFCFFAVFTLALFLTGTNMTSDGDIIYDDHQPIPGAVTSKQDAHDDAYTQQLQPLNEGSTMVSPSDVHDNAMNA
jgi:high-affinity iron transporter